MYWYCLVIFCRLCEITFVVLRWARMESNWLKQIWLLIVLACCSEPSYTNDEIDEEWSTKWYSSSQWIPECTNISVNSRTSLFHRDAENIIYWPMIDRLKRRNDRFDLQKKMPTLHRMVFKISNRKWYSDRNGNCQHWKLPSNWLLICNVVY